MDCLDFVRITVLNRTGYDLSVISEEIGIVVSVAGAIG